MYVSIIKTRQVVPFLILCSILPFAQNRNLTVEDQSSACYALWQMAMGCVCLHQNGCKKKDTNNQSSQCFEMILACLPAMKVVLTSVDLW